LTAWLDTSNRALPPDQRLFLPAVLMRAAVLALKDCPDMNGYYENGAYTPKAEIHLGVTVALKPNGVMVPAILDAHTLSLTELNAAFVDLVQRTRAGKLRNRELTDGTVTVTNVGELGADAVTGVIFPPQVALIGFGRIRKAAIVDADGGLRAGLVLDASLAADHRVSDGLAGSKLLNALGSLLAQPDRLA
jgi:pyruvate dehydrogenase E2 component (dihydrolipoamide acetyltransferase)